MDFTDSEWSLAIADLAVLKIQTLQTEVDSLTEEANKEIQIIREWQNRQTVPIQEEIEYLERKLHDFMTLQNNKTIELAHGILKLHKKPDRVEIADMDLFLKSATPEMITIIPEQIKPDLNKIKAFIKSQYIPEGVDIIPGEREFSYKIKEFNNGRTETTGPAVEPTDSDRIAV